MSSSSVREGAGESSRNSRSGFARAMARLPASILEGLSRSIARRGPRSRPRGVQVHQQQPPEGPPPLAPPSPTPFVPEELFFFSAFEQQYGDHHPFFYACRFSEVLGIARREGKHVFLYLHDPDQARAGRSLPGVASHGPGKGKIQQENLQEGIRKPRPSPNYTGQAGIRKLCLHTESEANTKVLIRFPNSERRQQSFRHTDTIREIYKYVNSLGIPGIGQYQFVPSYPRKTYGHQQLAMTLRDAGFHPSVTLYIEQLH